MILDLSYNYQDNICEQITWKQQNTSREREREREGGGAEEEERTKLHVKRACLYYTVVSLL